MPKSFTCEGVGISLPVFGHPATTRSPAMTFVLPVPWRTLWTRPFTFEE